MNSLKNKNILGKNVRILHLEDVKSDAEMVKREVVKSGMAFEWLWVSSRPAFQTALDDFRPDVIISDHTLPSFTSVQALKMVKEKGIAVPFILVTATVSEEFAVSIMKEGVADYVLKDRLQRLPPAILGALERHRSESEREQYLTEIINNENRFRSLIENSQDMLTLSNEAGDLAYISPAVRRTFGYQSEAEYPKNVFDVIHPDDRERRKQSLTKALEHPGLPIFTLSRNRKKDGNYIWVEGTLTNMLGISGVNALVSNFRDVSERKEAEDKVRKSEANLNAIIENADVSIYSLGRDFRYITFNNLLKNTLKSIYALDIQPGDQVFDFLEKLDPGEAGTWADIYAEALSGKLMRFEKEFKVGNFHSFVSFSVNPIWENEVVTGLSCFARDITEQKESELQRDRMTADLVQRNKDLEQFAYIVSHNLRAPVANILGISNVFNYPNLSESDTAQVIAGITSSAQKLDNVIVDLNNILQVRREINEKKVAVKFLDLVDDIQISIADLLRKENVTIVTNFKEIDGLLTVRSYLYSIFYNLISNSIKYRREAIDPVIQIISAVRNNHVVLQFRDNGIGIDLTRHGDKVFGLYKRFHSQEIEGKGMGLYMVKTQVESLGGKIGIASEVNKGTEFTIDFEK